MTLLSKFKAFLCAAVAVVSFLFTAPGARAQLAYTDGDLFLSFRASGGDGGTTDYMVNIGPAAPFISAGGQVNVDLGGDISADLELIYGTDWKTRADVFWSISGVQKVAGNSFPNNTMFASKAEASPGTQSVPWTSPSGFGAGVPAGKMQSMAGGYSTGTVVGGQSVSTNNPKALIQPTSSANSYASYQPGGSNTVFPSAFGIFVNGDNGIENTFPDGPAFSVLDLYSLAPGSGAGTLIGAFRMNGDGTLTFQKSISAFQGPATAKFEMAAYSVNEGPNAHAQLTITRSGDLNTSFTLSFSTSDSTAVAGTDYTAQPNTSISFGANEATKTVNVAVADLNGFQGNRSFTATLVVTSGTAQILNPGTATVTIVESTPEPSVLALSAATYPVAEDAGHLTVTINRTGPLSSAVSVNLSTVDGTALAGTDFEALTNFPVNFAAQQTSQTVDITITDRTDFSGDRNFTVSLTGASSGAVVGTPGSATVTVQETDMSPAGKIAFSASSYNFASKNALGQPNTVSVLLSRTNGTTGAITVDLSVGAGGTLDGSDFTFTSPATIHFADAEASKIVDIPLTAAVAPLPGVFNLHLGNPTGGATIGVIANTAINVVAPDKVAPKIVLTSPKAGKGTASFDVVGNVAEPDTVARVEVRLNGGAPMPATLGTPGGGVTSFSINGLAAENGTNTLLVQAFDNKGTASLVKKVVFTYTNTTLGLEGVYTGLAVPTALPAPGGNVHNASGLVSLTVGKTGTFTGKVLIGGATLPFSGVLTNGGVARFKPALGTTLALATKGKTPISFGDLAVSVAVDAATGTKATGTIGGIATIDAPRAFYDGKTSLLDPTYLLNKGKFTCVLPSKAQAVLVPSAFPQGDGIGGITILKTGKLTFIGSLADGTAVVASAPLSKNNKCPLYVPLYAKKGSIAGVVTLDKTKTLSDLGGTDFLWLRPLQAKAKQYVAGWPDGVKVDLMGAAYVVPPKGTIASVFPGLGADDLVNGNAEVDFADGKLGAPIHKNINISSKNKVTNAPATDKTFKVTLVSSTGGLLGSFTHSDGTKPAFKAITYQKGPTAGGYGYFLSLQPKNGPAGEGGGVTFVAK